jgi:hypothetical protein
MAINPKAKIVCMGDLNDDPIDKSVKEHLKTSSTKEGAVSPLLYNPMEELTKKESALLLIKINGICSIKLLLHQRFSIKT